MGVLVDHKPAMVLFALQFGYAVLTMSTRAVLLQGMNPSVFIVYRQAIATLVIAPIAYFRKKETSSCFLGVKSFSLIFMASLIGVAISQNIYYKGLYLASSSAASAMFNLVPAIAFLAAAIFGLEKVNIRSMRSIAKIIGTVLCVSGAAAMALLKGSKLLNAPLLPSNPEGDNWFLGCLFLFGSSCCWSFWLILQVAITANYPDHLSLTAWMCFMGTIQSTTIALFSAPKLDDWKMNTYLELACCLYSGIVGSGVSFFAQAWCIQKKGPVFSAMFQPLNTVIVATFASIFLHEEIYIFRSMAVNTNQNLSLRSVLEKDKLEENGNNYVDWIRSLGIVLKQERKLYILDGPVPPEPAANATKAEKDQHKKHVDDSIDVGCLMLASMCKALQKDLVHMEAYDLGNHLKEMFQLQARQERFDTMKALHSCKMIEGQPVGPHVLKMKGHLEHLERLGYPIQLELATDMILHSLPESYNQFVMNYNMNGMNKSLSELHGMLKNAENNIAKKTNQVLMVNKGKGFKKPKVKARVAKPEAKVAVVEKPQPKSQKDAVCYHCKETGHWRRNCKAYQEGLKKKGNEIAMTSGTKE